MSQYDVTTATRKVCALNKRIRAVAGGTSASKTISILMWIIDYAYVDHGRPKLITIVSESYPHLQDGAMRDFQNIMKDRGYWRSEDWHGTNHIYTTPYGNEIQFMAFDRYGKAHGPRRDVLYLNECNNIDYKIADQLITRTREIVWMDWNPTNEFWFYTDMVPHRADIDFITLTYKDNEALDQISIDEIESHRHNKSWWKVYGLGQLGEVEGQIFRGWKIIDEIPHEARLEVRGLDFGYARDKNALCDIYRYNGGYIIDELMSRVGIKNRQTADLILNQEDPNVLTIADSAELKSIDEMSEYGVNITGVQKVGGTGAISGNKESFTNSAIQFVQAQQMSVTKRSLNYIKSYRNFMWQTDRDGNIIPKYDHFMSDEMMSVVYGMTNFAPRERDTEVHTTGNFASMWQT